MFTNILSSLFLALLTVSPIASVNALGSQCTSELGAGTAAASDPYWLETIEHQGISAFGTSGYTVFRNVKDYGAVGDGE